MRNGDSVHAVSIADILLYDIINITLSHLLFKNFIK